MSAADEAEDQSKLALEVMLGVAVLALVLPARFVQEPLLETGLWLAFIYFLYRIRQSTGTLVAVTIAAFAHLGLLDLGGLPVVSITFFLALLFVYLGLAPPFGQIRDRVLATARLSGPTSWGAGLLIVVLTVGSVLALHEDRTTYTQHVASVTRYWIGFLALGAAVGLSREYRLLQFCAVFAVVALIANLIYIPLEVYVKFFADAYRWHLYPAGISLGFGMLNPNTLGYSSVFASVCALLVTTSRGPGYRYAAVAFWLLSGLVVLLTHSRGAGVAWVVSSMAALLVLGRRHWLLPIGALALVASAVWVLEQKYEIVPGSLEARWSELAESGDKWKSGSLTARLATVDLVLGDTDSSGGLRSRLFGVGFGVPLIRAESPTGGVYYRGSHFLPIDLYREVGVLGLAAFFATLILVLVGFALGLRRLSSEIRSRELAFVVGLMASQLVEQNSSGGMNGPTWLILLFGFLIGRGYRWTWTSLSEGDGVEASFRRSFR